MASIGQTPTRIPSASRSSLSFGTPSFISSPGSSQSLTPSGSSSSSSRSFKSLRALLPFGPGQGREPKSIHNKSGRKLSLNIESDRSNSFSQDRQGPFTPGRKSSVQDRSLPPSFLPPVIAIDRKREPTFTESVRRSISLTTLDQEKPLPKKPNEPRRESLPPASTLSSSVSNSPSAPPSPLPPSLKMLSTLVDSSSLSLPSTPPITISSPLPPVLPPSPGPDLSTIIEVDTSGVSLSKHIPSPSSKSSEADSSAVASPVDDSPLDESHLDLSISQLDAQVRDAMGSTPGWGPNDTEETSFSADVTVDMDGVNPDIAALLSPNNLTTRPAPPVLLARRPQQSSLPRLRPRSTATPPPREPSPSLRTGSPGSTTGRRSPGSRPPLSPLRPTAIPSRPHPTRKMSYGGEPLLPAVDPTQTPPTSFIPPRASAIRPTLDIHNSGARSRKRSLSASAPIRPTTSMSSPGSVEWLGPRTAKAFKAAGLLDDTPPQKPYHPRRGSVGDARYMTPPHADKYTTPDSTQRFGALNRFGSLRSDRSASRMSSSRRSPSSMAESPRSASTAPTSVAGFGGWEDDQTAKHAMEMSALLGALSDSQRTTRVLREENVELRERLDNVERERDKLMDIVKEREDELMAMDREGEVEERIGELEEENAVLRSVVDDLRREIGEMLGHGRVQTPPSPARSGRVFAPPLASSNSKRYSTASSVFPAPPPNMSMLLADEWERDRWQEQEDVNWTTTRDGGGDDDPTWTTARPRRPVSTSLSTANLSLLSDGESVRSLNLRPEHELHLEDMDALSLYEIGSESIGGL